MPSRWLRVLFGGYPRTPPSDAKTDTLAVVRSVPAYIAVASKLNGMQALACAEAMVEKLGSDAVYSVVYNAAVMPPIKNDDKGLLVHDLGAALEKGSPQTLNESSASNDAIIRLRGLLNRKGVVYDSVLVRMGGMNK